MDETMNNTITIEEVGVEAKAVLGDSDFVGMIDEACDEGNLTGVILGLGALAGVVIGGVAYAKKKKNNKDKKGFIQKMAVKYLTKKGYTVEEAESTESDDDDCCELKDDE